jgi:uncharacterized repeat protein (TIGR03809 family)
MPAGHPAQSLDLVIERWRALARNRHAYYLELLQSGRWRHYFNEQQFAERLRDVVASTRAWDGLAGNAPAPDRLPETRSVA